MYRGISVEVDCRSKDDSHDSRSLHSEISALSQLRHPNVIGFLGASFSSHSCLIVTELMAGGTLESLVLTKQQQRPHWRPCKTQTLCWSLDLVRAVNYMHQSDPAVVHRSLRPACLLISSTGVLKVAGFWSSRQASPCAAPPVAGIDIIADASDSVPPSPLACSFYVAPELARDPTLRDCRADVYSVAAVLWYMRMARHPQSSDFPQPPSRPSVAPCAADAVQLLRPCVRGLGWTALAGVVARGWAEEAWARPTSDGLTGELEGLLGGRAAMRERGGACGMS